MIRKPAITQEKINTLLATRWSGRAYDRERPVNQEHIVALLEAARWAPSCFGDQPWRYLLCNRYLHEEAWESALTSLTEGNQQWARNAPLLILIFADSRFSHNGNENRWAQYDTGAASMSLCLQATELGLMTHQMGGFDAEKLIQIFKIPERYTPMSVMAVGYQLGKGDIPEDMLERELGERSRKPLDELFFAGEWGANLP